MSAQQRLGVGRTRLYQLRHQWTRQRATLAPASSGGDHRAHWPKEGTAFLQAFLPDGQPLNCALIADELKARFAFSRSRTAVARHVATHLASFVATPPAQPRPRRRWQCAQIGELLLDTFLATYNRRHRVRTINATP